MADEGPLSLDQFAQEMTAEQEKAAAVDTTEEKAELEADLDAQGDGETQDDTESEGAEDETEGEEEEEKPPEPIIPPPSSWSKDDAAAWASLSPAAQLVVSRREADRDRAINVAMSRAGQAEKDMAEYAEGLKEWVPQVMRTFKDRWEGFDWQKLANDDPLEYPKYREAYEAEQAQVAHAKREADKAAELAFSSFVKQEAEKLSTLAPELADPKDGAARRKETADWLINDLRFEAEAVRNISAAELAIAYDAKRWRDSQAKTKADALKAKTNPPVKPVPKVISPVSGAPVSPQRRLQGLNERLTKSGKMDDFVALMNAEQEQAARKQVRR